jgi:hypothetical protein
MIQGSLSTRWLHLAAVSALLCTAVAGCGGTTRTSVSGKVTFDGEPVPTGQIVFEPIGPGRVGIAQIADGAYNMPPEQGPTAGSYIVRITANRPTGRKAAGGRGNERKTQMDQYEQFIPARYNEQSELKAEVGEGEIIRDFALTS